MIAMVIVLGVVGGGSASVVGDHRGSADGALFGGR